MLSNPAKSSELYSLSKQASPIRLQCYSLLVSFTMIRSGYDRILAYVATPTLAVKRAVSDQLRTRQDVLQEASIREILVKGCTSLSDNAELPSVLKALVSWRTHPITREVTSPLLVLFRECIRKQLGNEKTMAICEPIANYELHLLTGTPSVIDLPTVLTNVWIEHEFPSAKVRRCIYTSRSSVDGIVYALTRHIIASSASTLAAEEVRHKQHPIIPKIGKTNQVRRTNITPKKRRARKPKSLLLARVK